MGTPLSSSRIREFDSFLKSNNSPVDLFGDFFDCLALLIGEGYSFNEKLKSIMQDIIFDSKEAADDFRRRYKDHYTSIVALVEFLGTSEDGDALHAATQDVLDALFAAHSGSADELKGEMVHQSLFILHITFETYSIDYKNLTPERLMEEIESNFGEHLAGAIESLSAAAARIAKQKLSNEREMKKMAEALLYIVTQLNILRGQRIRSRNGTRSVEANDPCPCGSGKKYRECCMPGGTIH